MKVFFCTLGCKVNRYETEFLMNRFIENGFEISDNMDDADVYVINSCTVTAVSDKKTRQTLRKFKNRNPSAIVALTGCFPQAFKEEAEKINEADIITGSKNRYRLIDEVKRFSIEKKRIVNVTPHHEGEDIEKMNIPGLKNRTRSYIKIEDGCNRNCAYCIIPSARGFVRSKPPEEIKEELSLIIENCHGIHREVVLTGINLSSYGLDANYRLSDAVTTVCTTAGIDRVRLGSLEPDLLSLEDIKIFASHTNFCPHFHLSLQSGCDETLKRMNRFYNTDEYAAIVKNINDTFENPSITTDVIIGFPGETEEEFEKSLSFIKNIGFSKVHVFAYSDRPGTAASKMGEKIDNHTMKRRMTEMIKLAGNIKTDFYGTQTGKTAGVLFETSSENGYLGYSENYTPVCLKSDINLCGIIKQIKITDFNKDFCTGIAINNI